MSDPDINDFEYTLTRRALRQIKAQAWDEGYGHGYWRYEEEDNPYRDKKEA